MTPPVPAAETPNAAPEEKSESAGTARRSVRKHVLIFLLLGVVAFGAAAAVFVPRYELHRIGTASMSPAVKEWEDVLVDTSLADKKDLRRGEIVTFQSGTWADDSPGMTYTTRVVALGGDTVSCCSADGKLRINGKVVAEPYAHGDTGSPRTFDVKVPEGRVFVLADARNIGIDSRSALSQQGGTLPVEVMEGRVMAVANPLFDMGRVSGPSTGGFQLYMVGAVAAVVGCVLWAVALWPLLVLGVRRARALVRLIRKVKAQEW